MRRLALATLTAAAAVTALPALAQGLDELTVTGEARRAGVTPMTISRVVNYRDLNLGVDSDRQELRARVERTAKSICADLNEPPPTHHNLGKSCQERAVKDALGRVEVASVDGYSVPASARARIVANEPIPDTATNRARYGKPLSHTGRVSTARGD